MDPMEAIKITFFEECAELLESLEAGLLAMQDGTETPDTVDAVFRSVHSIKGGAAAFDLSTLVAYAHEFETTLDAVRSDRLAASPEVVSVLLTASDRLGDLVSAARNNEEMDAPDTKDLTDLLVGVSGGDEKPDFNPLALDLEIRPLEEDGNEDIDLAPTPISIFDDEEFTSSPGKTGRSWDILFEPLPELLTSGNEPLFLFRALEVLGKLTVEAVDGDLASLSDMDVSIPRLRWKILLEPTAPDLTETEIESVFEFAVDLCVLELTATSETVDADADPNLQTVTPRDTADSSAAPRTTPAKNPTAIVADVPVSQKAPAPASTKPAPPKTSATAAAAAPSIRVDLTRVDRLVNLVGELVISQSMLAQGMSRAGLDQHSEAVSRLDELQQLTRDMQDSVMSIRAQPVKSLFQRMTRIVREGAQATGKDVRLVTEGEGTEIDKTVVERLADPLTHMIRNSIDHGLEDPAERAETDKPQIGVVRLNARQQSDRVIIEVSDDGRGINRKRVLERAVERGLVPANKQLEDSEIDRLLFMPGFSTAATVSALSGRGVGMDVVQRAIRDLNGTISVSSAPGRGCSISISLPLTLAILDGMIVKSRSQRMVIPLSTIVETQTVGAARIESLGPDRTVVLLHDRFVPIIDLATGMGFPPLSKTPIYEDDDSALLFVEPEESGAYALRVDAIEAQRQVVIKGLGENFGHIPCVSAATILGDGQVALIVDPAGIASMSGLDRATQPHPMPEVHAQ